MPVVVRRRLIVNADGLGFGPGASRGVIEAVTAGAFITSVSLNTNFAEVDHVDEILAHSRVVSVGIHVNPVAGPPVLPPQRVPTLVDENGVFWGAAFQWKMRHGRIAMNELESELDAQIRKGKELVGDRLTHLDSHGNSHLQYLGLFARLARKHGIERCRTNASTIALEDRNPRARRAWTYTTRPHIAAAHVWRRVQMRHLKRTGLRMADRLVTVGYGGSSGGKGELENWERILKNLPPGTSEIYCHPGYMDAFLEQYAVRCRRQRESERRTLLDPSLPRLAESLGIELIPFFGL